MGRPALAVVLAAVLEAAGASHAPIQRTTRFDDELRLAAIRRAEENRAASAGELRELIAGTRAGSPSVQAAAARALGRLERRDVIPSLVPLLRARDEAVRSEAANAIAQAFRGEPLAKPTSREHLNLVQPALLAAPRSNALHRAVGRLPYETVEQVRAAEMFLLEPLEAASPPASAARGLEALGRLRPRLTPLEDETIERLRALAGRASERTIAPDVRRNAMLALLQWQGADTHTLEAALTDDEFEVRRLAVLAIAGAGAALTPEEVLSFLNNALQDRAPQVRLEALRGWARLAAARHGCFPLTAALGDPDLHVVIAALDALGEQCQDDDQITDAVTAEARTPPARGAWQREAHALLALAKRSRPRTVIAMSGFSRHENPHVRVYAARAAAIIDDTDTLRALARFDPDDNVVEATLAPLRKRLEETSDVIFVEALKRRTRSTGRGAPARPYQVYREAAIQLSGGTPSPQLLEALIGALQDATADRCETSRDARLALISRIVEFGSSAQAHVLVPLLRDIDPEVAKAAASGIETWTGKRPEIQPPPRQPEIIRPGRRSDDVFLNVEMENGRVFRIAFYSEQAPLTRSRIMSLAGRRFYDDLTFHRVVPNFVIQGGSPNANEYCGDCPYMRDEVGLAMHLRGTVGVSTRGRDTGDAQFFVNLVDNPRLDHEYTVFGYVCPADMAVVDQIQEGDRMARVSIARNQRLSCSVPR